MPLAMTGMFNNNHFKKLSLRGFMKQTICLIALFSVIGASSALANMNESKARSMDSNNDGMVSQSERDAHMQKFYKEADADHNGTVTQDEWAIYQVSKKDQYTFAGQREDQNLNRYQYSQLPLKDYNEKWNYNRADRADNYNQYAPAAGARMNDREAYRYEDYSRADGSDRYSDPQRSPYYR
jgi:hypothetical protein